MKDPLKRYGFEDREGHPLENCVDYREILKDVARMQFLEKFLQPTGKVKVETRPEIGWLVLDSEKQGSDTLREAIDAEMARMGIAFRLEGDPL